MCVGECTLTDTPSDTASSHQTACHRQSALPASPADDGMSSLSASVTTTSSCCCSQSTLSHYSSTQSSCRHANVAVVHPLFNLAQMTAAAAAADNDQTDVKTLAHTHQSHHHDDDDDDETNPKLVVTAGNFVSHSGSGISQHHSDDVTSPAAVIYSDVTLDMPSDACRHCDSAPVSDESRDQSGNQSQHDSLQETADESLSSLMMPESRDVSDECLASVDDKKPSCVVS